jgi:predicted aspartyl protease
MGKVQQSIGVGKYSPRLGLAFLIALVTFVISPQFCVSAEQGYFERGVAEYQLKHYAEAANLLDAANAEGSAGPDSFYYAALAHEQLKHFKMAGRLYQTVIEQFPNSPASVLAKNAIKRPEFLEMLSPFSSNSRKASLDSLPRETYISFHDRNGALLIDGAINERPIKMIFDTGAAACCCSVHNLEQLGIECPAGKPDLFIAGVGSKDKIPGWKMLVTLSVGRIVRQKFPIFVSTVDLPAPLLGQNFFRDFQYTIDKNAQTISFKRVDRDQATSTAMPTKTVVTVNSSGKYEYAVPFNMDGQAVIVVAKINGRDCPVQFDTGASICMFSTNQIDAVGGAKATGRHISVTGAGGMTVCQLFELSSLQLGPITKPVIVAVSDQSRMKYPLLGQNFFKDLQYTIDYTNHVIKFEK